MDRDYKFTRNCFAPVANLLKYVNIGTTTELHILEVGSIEGKSTVWFLDNFINN